MVRIARVVRPGVCYVGRNWHEWMQRKVKIAKIKNGVPEFPSMRWVKNMSHSYEEIKCNL